ncbi:MAG: curli production assembly/transport protein CsgE [Balneolia bacterium]|nr:curli production assembly/transport protein CsgE [Balneolia bacterium]
MKTFALISIAIFIASSSAVAQQSAGCEYNYEIFESNQTVSVEDLAEFFGSLSFSEIIRESNAEVLNEDGVIPAGVQIQVPMNIARYNSGDMPLEYALDNPYCDPDEDEDTMEAFRRAFESLVNEEQGAAVQQQQQERQLIMEVDGMIYDETMSKIGRDFYDVFYTYWQSPPDAYNYSIVVSEQPAPGMGTIVSIRVNDHLMFNTRLQPRFDFIEEVGRQAVQVTYNFLQNGQYQQQIY